LKYGLECLWGWEVRADNFQVTISGEHLTPAMFESAISEVTTPEFWQQKSTQEYLLKNLPNYRFSKFQQVLPDRYALEMVQGYLLDLEEISKLKIDRSRQKFTVP
jgi:ATP-dependent helicase Lhr and Lhr-like helicase